jgi:hypothetical protein
MLQINSKCIPIYGLFNDANNTSYSTEWYDGKMVREVSRYIPELS